ncbi:MAG: hypothetical protein AAFW98_16015, partial [Pseudomonadota bacterium]
ERLGAHYADERSEKAKAVLIHHAVLGSLERFIGILLEHYDLPGALEQAVGDFVDHYNNRRAHESLGNVTPADATFDRAPAILEERRTIKERTIRQRRLHNLSQAA